MTVERQSEARIDPTVFWIAAAISAVFVLWGILFTENLAGVFDTV
jgi:choline-glycine betaine transporter